MSQSNVTYLLHDTKPTTHTILASRLNSLAHGRPTCIFFFWRGQTLPAGGDDSETQWRKQIHL